MPADALSVVAVPAPALRFCGWAGVAGVAEGAALADCWAAVCPAGAFALAPGVGWAATAAGSGAAGATTAGAGVTAAMVASGGRWGGSGAGVPSTEGDGPAE